jgi:WD40 repeat protein
VRTLRGHTDWVLAVCFSLDSQLVCSGSDDTTARIWRVKTGEVGVPITPLSNGRLLRDALCGRSRAVCAPSWCTC